jgi:hypothetical protein
MHAAFSERIAQMSNEGLTDVCMHPADYQEDFIDMAKQELIRRGVDISAQTAVLNEKMKKELEAFSAGRPGNSDYIMMGFIFAALGGLLGFFIGLNYAFKKTWGPDGKRYFEYNEKTRKNGMLMIGIALLAVLITVSWGIGM